MIKVNIETCTGCRSCEVACAFYHSGKINNNASRIKLISIYEKGIDGPVVCVQCVERYCLTCPDKAIRLGSNGEITASSSLCSLCKKCRNKCPIGAIEIFNDLMYVCDLCDGSPKCVEACTEGALTFAPDDTQLVSLAGIRKETLKMSPSEKRQHYIASQGRKLRKKWTAQDA
ncbi:MAG: hypothetical protein GY847_32420 [Proteobacteria bacterium]|nr:hypothetical protein [Pseudomonadota bacterium]